MILNMSVSDFIAELNPAYFRKHFVSGDWATNETHHLFQFDSDASWWNYFYIEVLNHTTVDVRVEVNVPRKDIMVKYSALKKTKILFKEV